MSLAGTNSEILGSKTLLLRFSRQYNVVVGVGKQPGKVVLPKVSLARINSEILGSKTLLLLGFSR